jgi:phosphopantothenoylcysteine decarboxylase / phosphopantothenate---cysteine ligase
LAATLGLPMARSKPRNSPLRVLVSAGPTREHVDPVRFLSNESSGRMGFALAEAFARAGHAVTLVAGPVHLPTPKGVERIDVTSAREMLAACRKAFQIADVLVMAAAVADWRPARVLGGKWRAKDGAARRANLALVRNPDILATLAARKGGRLVCGFALETGGGERRARAKLLRKQLDCIVLNDAAVLNAEDTRVLLLEREGRKTALSGSKQRVARALVARIERIRASRS